MKRPFTENGRVTVIITADWKWKWKRKWKREWKREWKWKWKWKCKWQVLLAG